MANAIILKSGKVIKCIGSHANTLKLVLNISKYIDDEQEIQLMIENNILYYSSNETEISLQVYALNSLQYSSILQLIKDDLANQTYFIINNNNFETFFQLKNALQQHISQNNDVKISIFKNDSNLTSVVKLDKSYEYSNMSSIIDANLTCDKIYKCSFVNCINLKNVVLHNVKAIEQEAFNSCEKLTNVDLPNTLSIICGDAFANCTSLSSIDLPESLEYIDNTSFKNCIQLSTVRIPSNVKSIGYAAFENCYALKQVSIPTKLELISENAFNNCINLSSVIFY